MLDLSRNNLSATSVGYLIEGKWPKLHTLDLSHNGVTLSVMALLRDGSWPLLQTLKLNACQRFADEPDAAELATGNWQKLKCLELGSNFLSTGVQQIIGPLLSGLTSLDLSCNCLRDDAILELSLESLPNLHRLVLAHNFMADGDLKVASTQWSQLTYLDLSYCIMFRPMLSNCQHLQYLSLAGYNGSFPEQALACLADQLPQLRVLDLSGQNLWYADVEQLVSRHWPELVELKFIKNVLPSAAITLLRTACGGGLFKLPAGARTYAVKLPTSYTGP